MIADVLPLAEAEPPLPRRSLAAAVEERLLVPAYASWWGGASVAAHRCLAFPFQIAGECRRRSIVVGGTTVEILEVGREKLVRPICERLFGELPPAQRESRQTVYDPAKVDLSGIDLAVVEVHRWIAPRFRRAGWVLIPDAVRWRGDLAEFPPAQPSRSLRDDLRKVRNHGFTIEHTRARRDWEEFYSTMVRPQARARYGDSAWFPSARLLRTFERVGTLHLVSLNGARVAGTCSIGSGRVLWLPLTGIRHGDRTLMQKGASAAAFALTAEWARSTGYRRIDLGRTSPFVNDGVQQFKRKWGLLPVPESLAHLSAVLARSETVRAAFAREPVIVEQGRDLRIYSGQV